MTRRKTQSARSSKRSATPISLQGLLIVAVLIAALYLWNQGYIQRWLNGTGLPTPADETPAAPPDASGGSGNGAIQIFFTTPSLVYPDVTANRAPPPHEAALVADIDAAKQSVDMAVYEYNLVSIADALVRAKQRGVAVRLVLDRENLDNAPMSKWAGQVQKASIPVSWEETDAFMHSKFIIIDNALVWTGSWNATTNDTYRNNNNLLRITIPELVANYHFEFEQLFAGRFDSSKQSPPNPRVQAGAISIENYFSPQDRQQQAIVKRIEGAQQSVRFLAFSYTSDPIGDAMIDRAKAGVQVQGVIEGRNAGGLGSEMPRLQSAGISVLEDGNCYTMHNKIIIIDERTVITGSYNFTSRAEAVNDENFLIIDDPTIARAYIGEFERVYGQAQNPTRCKS